MPARAVLAAVGIAAAVCVWRFGGDAGSGRRRRSHLRRGIAVTAGGTNGGPTGPAPSASEPGRATRPAVVPVVPAVSARVRPPARRRLAPEALARVAGITRRRRTDVAVHVGAIVLALSALLAPLGAAVAAPAPCATGCEGVAPDVAAADEFGAPTAEPVLPDTFVPETVGPPDAALNSTASIAAMAVHTATTTTQTPPLTTTADTTTAARTTAAPAAPAPVTTAPVVALPVRPVPRTTVVSTPARRSSTVATTSTRAPTTTTSPTATTSPAATTSRTATTTTAPPTSTTAPAGGDGVTAADTQGWGQPGRADEFTGTLAAWGLYDGPGHVGNGRRSPTAESVGSGVLTIAGDAQGTTGGMAWGAGATYGRWEGRVRAPAADPSYHAVMLLWPDAENWPVGGEVDFMEMSDPSRQQTDAFLHYGASNSQLHGAVTVDATQWHNWAVEWTPDHITTFLDGRPWWTTTNRSALPPGPMHLCLQLDWFPSGGAVQPSTMQVDWVRYYPYAR